MTHSFRGDPALSGIGPACRISGLTPRAVRLYEARGMIKPHRNSRGFRSYDSETLQRLIFIATARQVGLSLAEISQLLSIGDRQGPEARHRSLSAMLAAHQEAAIARLDRIRSLAPRLGVSIGLDERAA